jgi:hypothetical protein
MTRFEILSVLLAACSSSAPVATGFRVVDSSGATPSSATVGDALQLSVLQTFSDGTTRPVSGDAALSTQDCADIFAFLRTQTH